MYHAVASAGTEMSISQQNKTDSRLYPILSANSTSLEPKGNKEQDDITPKVYWKASTKGKANLLPKVILPKGTHRDDDDDFVDKKLKRNGRFTEIPNLLDGFRMLNWARCDDPDDVYALDLSRQDLALVVDADLAMFRNLNSLNASENSIPLAKMGIFPNLKKLIFSCNGVRQLDLESEGNFSKLEYLDLSYNNVDQSALIVLGTLPALQTLDLTGNKLSSLTPHLLDMENWKEHVIEIIFPQEVAALDLKRQNSFPSNPSESLYNKDKNSMVSANEIQHPRPVVVGFQNLTTLILEHNSFNDKSTTELFYILGHLPKLKILNMNRTGLKSLDGLIPMGFSEYSLEHFLNLEKPDLDFGMFPSLIEFSILENKINTVESLIGSIFCPKLKYLYIDGNPVARALFGGVFTASSNKNQQLNLLSVLENNFMLKIVDKSFSGKPSTIAGELFSVIPERLNQKDKVLQFNRKLVTRKKMQLSELNQVPIRTVPDFKSTTQLNIKERLKRRQHVFTEEEIRMIISQGYIPNINDLIDATKPVEKDITQRIDSLIAANEAHQLSNQFEYNMEVKDQTFVTGLHIKGQVTETTPPEKPKENLILPPDIEYGMELEVELPKGITESVKALRKALKNPGSIWQSIQAKRKEQIRNIDFNHSVKQLALPPRSRLPADEYEELEEILSFAQDKVSNLSNALGISI